MSHRCGSEEGNGMSGQEQKRDTGQAISVDNLQDTLARVEREMIVMALRASRGNKARAARALGITERLMGLRVKKYGIDPKQFRTSR